MSREGLSIRDLSRELGISASTISRVMNHPEQVKDETKNLILDYLEKNNLSMPRSVSKNKYVIGLTFSDPFSIFTSMVISEIEKKLSGTNYNLMLFNLEKRMDAYEYFSEHQEFLKKIDGLIISSTILSSEGSKYFKKLNIPVVVFHSRCEGEQCILTNNYKGGQEAATFMRERGYKNIAFVGWEPADEHIQDRLQGFNSVYSLDSNKIKYAPLSADGGYAATDLLMSEEDKPDAIFYACDAMAAGGMRYMREHKINVNDEIGIMGFDNMPISELMGITTMTQFVDSEVSIAVDYLIGRLEHPEASYRNDEISITPKLVVRTSLK